MKRLLRRLFARYALTPEQANRIAVIRFPCC